MEKEKFLGTKEVEDGTGISVGRVVSDLLAVWSLTPQTPGSNAIAFSIDTCIVNMGRDLGENLYMFSVLAIIDGTWIPTQVLNIQHCL